MRTLGLVLAPSFLAAAAAAQTTPGPTEVAVYGSLGRQHGTHTAGDPYNFSTGGGYLQYTPHLLQPGLDLRLSGSESSVNGLLVGPRVALVPRGSFTLLHLYAEALFGPNTFTEYLDQAPFTKTDRNGITSEAVVGLDFSFSQHVRWRAFEASAGTFSGIPNSHPVSLSTGILWHFEP